MLSLPMAPNWKISRCLQIAHRNCPHSAHVTKTTARGFEPLRAEPNGFRVHLLNRSDTLSITAFVTCSIWATCADFIDVSNADGRLGLHFMLAKHLDAGIHLCAGAVRLCHCDQFAHTHTNCCRHTIWFKSDVGLLLLFICVFSIKQLNPHDDDKWKKHKIQNDYPSATLNRGYLIVSQSQVSRLFVT